MNASFLSKSQTFFISVILPSGTTRFPVNKQKKEKRFLFNHLSGFVWYTSNRSPDTRKTTPVAPGEG